jgi:hypothetical protein
VSNYTAVICRHGVAKFKCSYCMEHRNWQPGNWAEIFQPVAAMTEQVAVGAHDFDEFKRICKRCGATGAMILAGAACETGDLDLTGWQDLTTEEKAERRQRNIDQAKARHARGVTAAADDYPTISKRLKEIELENAHPLREMQPLGCQNVWDGLRERYPHFSFGRKEGPTE